MFYLQLVNSDLDFVIAQLEDDFNQNAHPSQAAAMAKYMKHLFIYLGIKKPLRAELEAPFIATCKKLPYDSLTYLVKTLWQKEAREYQYTAMVLMRSSKIYKHKQSIELLEWLLVNKSWWDSVDAIAAQLVGPYFLQHPAQQAKYIDAWKHSSNMWLNRTTLIFQLKHKFKTDIPLLFGLLEYFAPEKEFFIKKAVGWALRQLSYTHPVEVVEFVNTHRLQPLSRREALKALERKGTL